MTWTNALFIILFSISYLMLRGALNVLLLYMHLLILIALFKVSVWRLHIQVQVVRAIFMLFIEVFNDIRVLSFNEMQLVFFWKLVESKLDEGGQRVLDL